MKNILVLGAGQSATYLITYLLEQAEKHEWFVTVGDVDKELATKSIKRHLCGSSILFDVNDAEMRSAQIEKADVVVNLLPPIFQYLVSMTCVEKGKHMITASYQDEKIMYLDNDAHRKGILLLNEMGLDPGIDHMSSMSMIKDIRNRGGKITSFKSYGGGLPAPEVKSNPLRYVITWNPRNVVMAGKFGAQYLYKNKVKLLPHHEVFQRTWPMEIDGIGKLEAYPNRDSLKYKELFGLEYAHTMIRGTLRYPGWSETWEQIVRLGLYNESMHIPDLQNKSYSDLLDMFLPLHQSSLNLDHRVANFLNISPTGKIMENLNWLGLFSEEKISCKGDTSCAVMTDILTRKLKLEKTDRDMVVLHHELEAEFSEKDKQKFTATFIEYGDPGGATAMAKTVGLPAAIACKLLLLGDLPITGCHIPTHPAIYPKVLKELEELGLKFKEKSEKIVG